MIKTPWDKEIADLIERNPEDGEIPILLAKQKSYGQGMTEGYRKAKEEDRELVEALGTLLEVTKAEGRRLPWIIQDAYDLAAQALAKWKGEGK